MGTRTQSVTKRKRVWKKKAKADRRNLRLWAEGARETLLKAHVEGYTDALERGWRAERDYVREVCNEYHARIPWTLEDHEEPEEPLPEYNKFETPENDDNLDEETLARKNKRVEEMNARIHRWLKYRARRLQKSTRMDTRNDPFAVLLAKLAGINAPPKARQGFQQYMHESYETEIGPVVTARWTTTCVKADGSTLKQKRGPDAPFRAKVARELFAELSQDEQDALRDRAQAEAKEARDEYNKAMKAPPSKRPEDRQKCIDRLGGFMLNILRGVNEYTGLKAFCVFGGPIPQFGGELRTVHVSMGRNLGAGACTFPEWSKARFDREVLDFMKDWLRTGYTASDCAEAALPAEDDSEDLLKGAKYRIDPKSGASDDDSDSDSASSNGSDSDSESDDAADSSESESGSESDDEGAARKKSKKSTKKEKEREREREKKKAKARKLKEKAAAQKAKGTVADDSVPDSEAAATPTSDETNVVHAPSASPDVNAEDGGNSTTGAVDGANSSTDVERQLEVDTAANTDMDVDAPPPITAFHLSNSPSSSATSATARNTDGEDELEKEAEEEPIPAAPDDAAAWFVATHKQLSAENLGANFNELLRALANLERRYGWAQGGKALPTTHRPAQVTLWLGQGRGQRPGIMSQGRGPNPAWRKGTGDNPTAHAQEYPDSGDETSWSPLRSPGAN
ncbi:hypothetical protein B0H12DRAFT_1241159, partial [Mycena haematopus]